MNWQGRGRDARATKQWRLPDELWASVAHRLARWFDGFEELGDDFFDGDAFGFGAVVDEDAVAEDGGGEGADVVGGDVGAAGEEGADLGAQDQVLAGAEA